MLLYQPTERLLGNMKGKVDDFFLFNYVVFSEYFLFLNGGKFNETVLS